jgi:hypothetical protein
MRPAHFLENIQKVAKVKSHSYMKKKLCQQNGLGHFAGIVSFSCMNKTGGTPQACHRF